MGFWLRAALAASSVVAPLAVACTETVERGQLMVVVTTDLSLPDDVDTGSIEISVQGVIAHEGRFTLGDEVKIPATLGIVGDDPSAPVTVKVFAWQGDTVRIARKAVTTVPARRVATLPMPLGWLCDGKIANQGASDVRSDCPELTDTCVAGECRPSAVEESTLADYAPEAVFGGGEAPGAGSCIPVEDCFAPSERVFVGVNHQTCTFPAPSDLTNLNIGLIVSDAAPAGQCDGDCIVALDRGDEGWDALDDGSIRLPAEVCRRLDDGRIAAVVASAACETKTFSLPTCGPWSAAPNPTTVGETTGLGGFVGIPDGGGLGGSTGGAGGTGNVGGVSGMGGTTGTGGLAFDGGVAGAGQGGAGGIAGSGGSAGVSQGGAAGSTPTLDSGIPDSAADAGGGADSGPIVANPPCVPVSTVSSVHTTQIVSAANGAVVSGSFAADAGVTFDPLDVITNAGRLTLDAAGNYSFEPSSLPLAFDIGVTATTSTGTEDVCVNALVVDTSSMSVLVGTDWATAASWNPPGVPSAAQAAYVQAGTHALNTPATVGQVFVESGATFAIGAASPLSVTSGFVSAGTITGPIEMANGTTIAGTAGELRCLGALTLGGAVSASLFTDTLGGNCSVDFSTYRLGTTGDVTLTGGGTVLVQTSPRSLLTVGGNLSVSGATGTVTDGETRVAGDTTVQFQSGGPSGNHWYVLTGAGAQQFGVAQAANVDLGDGPGVATLTVALTAAGTVRTNRETTVTSTLTTTTLDLGSNFSTTTPSNFAATTCLETVAGTCASLGL